MEEFKFVTFLSNQRIRNDFMSLSKKEFLWKYSCLVEGQYKNAEQEMNNYRILQKLSTQQVTYPKTEPKDSVELAGKIIHIFMNFLENKGIILPNPEPNNNGNDYKTLETTIKETIKTWEKENQ